MFNPNQAANVNPNFPGVNTLNQDLNGRFSGLNPLSQAGNGNMSFPGSNAPNQGSNIGGLSANPLSQAGNGNMSFPGSNAPNQGSNIGGLSANLGPNSSLPMGIGQNGGYTQGSNIPNLGLNTGGFQGNNIPNPGSNLGGFQGNNAGLNRNGLSYANQTSYSNQVYIWKWDCEDGLKTPYSQELSLYIENCLQTNQTPQFSVNTDKGVKNYMIDFNTMTQINRETGFKKFNIF